MLSRGRGKSHASPAPVAPPRWPGAISPMMWGGAAVFMYMPCKMARPEPPELSTDPVSEESPGCALYAANVLHSNEAATKLARTHAALLWAKTLDRKTIIDGNVRRIEDCDKVITEGVDGAYLVHCLRGNLDYDVPIRVKECYKVDKGGKVLARLQSIGFNDLAVFVRPIISTDNQLGEKMMEIQNKFLIKFGEEDAFRQLSPYYMMRLFGENDLEKIFHGAKLYYVESDAGEDRDLSEQDEPVPAQDPHGQDRAGPVSDPPEQVVAPLGARGPKKIPRFPRIVGAARAQHAIASPTHGRPKHAIASPTHGRPSKSKRTRAGQTKTKEGCDVYKRLLRAYYPEYKPPAWVESECESILARLGTEAMVLYVEGTEMDRVEMLAREREPVVIGNPITLNPKYNLEEMKHVFPDWTGGAYGKLSEGGTQLPPQIAVACETPVRWGEGEPVDVAVVSIVAMAFDHENQPDYTYFHDENGLLKVEDLIRAMAQAYILAFEAAHQMGRTLYVSAIGDGAFRPRVHYPAAESFVQDIVVPAVQRAAALYPNQAFEWVKHPPYSVPESFFNSKTPTYSSGLDKKLFVNAWDPWSMLGNGNSSDQSLDGFWGRSSAIALLGWPRSNPSIKYVAAPRANLHQIHGGVLSA